MKKLIITFTLIGMVLFGFSQENMVSVSGGYAWTKIDVSDYYDTDTELKGSGWRINGTYDFRKNEGKWAYGVSLGYIGLTATYEGAFDTTEYSLSSVPLYFAPKYLFGNEKIDGFIKLAIGGQSASLKNNDTGTKVSSYGFYGGGGAGLLFHVSEKVYLHAEYEIVYVTNGYYQNGLVQSAMAGIGIKF
jgi:hypothetical protein